MLMAANPCADAERWNDYQAASEAAEEAQHKRAMKFFESALACNAKSWYTDPVRVYEDPTASMSPDEIVWDLVQHETNPKYVEIRRLFAELMTSEAAKALRTEAARLMATNYPEMGAIDADDY